jgi:hypothetical protein
MDPTLSRKLSLVKIEVKSFVDKFVGLSFGRAQNTNDICPCERRPPF